MKAWFELVTLPIWNKHQTQKKLESHEAEVIAETDKWIDKHPSYPFLSMYHIERGLGPYTLYDIFEHNKIIEFAQSYQRMYVMQIIRFLSVIFFKLEDKFWNTGTDLKIPYLSEIFYIFNAEDSDFKKRKTWSLYKR